MPFPANKFLTQSLLKRQEQNTFRNLSPESKLIDFCSNDYLGFSRSETLRQNIEQEYLSLTHVKNGSTGSRLLTGNSDYAEYLEKKIAAFHSVEAGLLYNSGYDANVGLFSALGRRGDTFIYDELIHASIHDGMRLSKADCLPFKHNNLYELEEQLKAAQGTVYVAVESIYSMDGDVAPLMQMVALCQQYKANLIVDEAHATGVTLNEGKGLVQQLGIESAVFARVHTFGKALGCHGAIVLGSDLLRVFLINYSRSFIYTTAMPLKNLVAINQAYDLLQQNNNNLQHLHTLIKCFKNNIKSNKNIQLIESDSPIQSIIISGSDNVKLVANKIKEAGYDVRAIVSPTVAKGAERLRICIHAFNTEKQIEGLCNIINTI